MEKRSMKSYFIAIITLIITIQILIQVSMLMVTGVFREAKRSSYESFIDSNRHRKEFLEKEILLHWTKLHPYLENLQEKLDEDSLAEKEIIDLAMNHLIDLLRATGTTGSFIILGDPITLNTEYKTLYLRDYDPVTNSPHNNDIYLRYGPSDLASKHKLPLDSNWEEKIYLDSNNIEFFKTSYNMPKNIVRKKYMGYWSPPFKLSEDDIELVTYSLPLQSYTGKTLGILGVEVNINYLSKLLPTSESIGTSSLGYIIAEKDLKEDKLYPLIIANNNLRNIIDVDEALNFERADKKREIYLLTNNKFPKDIYLAISKIDLYPYATPYERDIFLISFIMASDLLYQVNKFSRVLNLSLITTLIFGIFAGILGSIKMSKPVLDLVHQVANHDKTKSLSLSASDFAELDSLSRAIVETNREMIDSASQISRVIEMVNLPMVVFEIHEDKDVVLVTDNFLDFFKGFYEPKVLENKTSFIRFLNKLKEHPEPEEENTYRLDPFFDRWINIKTRGFDKKVYGVIQDVSEEILEKKQIKLDRDLDPLTQILNRNSFKTQYYEWHGSRSQKVAAFFMFDLDDLKKINDSYGHKWGDYYIKEAVKHLQGITNKDRYILARRSGDEFMMLLYDFESKQEVRNAVSNFYKKLKEKNLLLPNGYHAGIEISAGFVWVGRKNYRFEKLLEEADKIMYYTKRNKKGYFTEGNKDLLKYGFGGSYE